MANLYIVLWYIDLHTNITLGYLHMDQVGQEVPVYQVFLQSQWLQADHPTQGLLVFHLVP